MKRYLFFPNLISDWQEIPIQSILCGNPRIVNINPVSNASAYLWEQVQPDPLAIAVTFIPNNTSKNITIAIPNNINTYIILKVTLNGDINNYKFVYINPLLEDFNIIATKGSFIGVSNNTLNDPVPAILAPVPSLGPQVIRYTNSSQTTGIRFLSQSYRLGYTEGVTVNSTYIPFYLNIYDRTPDTRLQLNINTDFTILKDWTGISVFSQDIIPVNSIINISYPSFIADEYINSISKGAFTVSSTRTPFTTSNYNLVDTLSNNISKGAFTVLSTRTPFTASNYNLVDTLSTIITKGGFTTAFTRTPYTSNIIG